MVRRDGPEGVHVGRYLLHDEIASGGMGTVHLGQLHGGAGFSRIVAIKRLNPLLAKEPEFLRMFLDEARLAGRVRHPNVVPASDVVEAGGEVLLVMEYVHGDSLSRLLRLTRERGHRVSPAIASAVLSGVLYGLHAAHEATDERGDPLGIVHRDVSPQNILVGTDGVPRLVDFGVAKATGRLQTTTQGQIKGKLAYMPPEQIQGQVVDRRADIYAAGVVLWETLTGKRLFLGENEGHTLQRVLLGGAAPPSALVADLPPALDDVVLRALAGTPSGRFSTAREMGAALLVACPPAPPHVVGEWVEACAHEALSARSVRVAELETSSSAVRVPSDAAKTTVPRELEAPPSQISSISVSGDRAAARPRRVGPLIALVIALLLVAIAGRSLLRSPKATAFAEHPAPPSEPPVASAPSAVVPGPAVLPAPPATAKAEAADAAAPRLPPHPVARPRAAAPPTPRRGQLRPAVRPVARRTQAMEA